MQLNPNASYEGLFTVAVKGIFKKPMTFTKRETEDDGSDGGHYDKDENEHDCDGDNAMMLMIIILMTALFMVTLSDRAVRLRYLTYILRAKAKHKLLVL